MKARVKDALHRYSVFGKIAEIADRRRQFYAKRVEVSKAKVKRLEDRDAKAQVDLHLTTVRQREDLQEELAVAEVGLKTAMRRAAFWQKRYVWAKDRHDQWGNILRRRRRALRLWLGIHRTFGAGGFAPTSFWVHQRIDQGDDIEIKLGDHLRAPGDGEVIEWAHDGPFPNGFGDPYAVVVFTTGPFAGVGPMYLGHVNADVPPVGRHFKEGDRLGKVTNSLHAGLGWAEIGLWPPGAMGNGAKIEHLFKEVRA